MTIQITLPELETLIHRRLETGLFKDVEDVLFHALKSSEPGPPTDDSKRNEAIDRLETFGERHRLSLDGMTIRQLREEARP